MANAKMIEQWEEITSPGWALREVPESGSHRVAEDTCPHPPELDAPSFLPRDELCSIIAEYVSRVGDWKAALHVHETLDRLGVQGSGVPQPLAGHLVLSLSNQITCPEKRSAFLAHSWHILGRTE